MNQLSQQDSKNLLELIRYTKDRNRLSYYKPYPKQLDFHNAGAKYRERLFRAGNQLGKTYAGACEVSYHATGKYPDWWSGLRFDGPTRGWVSGVTNEVTRDTVQRLLVGPPSDIGTGFIPAKDIEKTTSARGLTDLLDTIHIRHVSGGTSLIRVKSYEQGREKWQADTLNWIWFDEEPPEDIYTEGLTRTNATGGRVWLTFTPLLGMSEVVRRFLTETNPDRHDTNMTIEDAEHIGPEERERIIASYPPHEREARTKGIPILGSGRIFPIAEESISVEPFDIPKHWPQIGGLDFGWDHPTAAIKMAWDRDADCIYLTAAYRAREATPIIHAAALRAWGDWLPFAWPHDGLQHDKGSGEQIAEIYRQQGLNLLLDRATFDDGSTGVEAGLMEMLDRMQTSRWRVFNNLNEWFEEFRLYHRKDGKIVKEHDDLICASRYAMMMLRYAVLNKKSAPINYNSKWVV